MQTYNISSEELVFRQIQREKGGNLTQSYDKNPYTNRKFEMQNTNTPPKTSIKQRLRTDLGRSIGVATTIQLVLLNRFTGTQPSH